MSRIISLDWLAMPLRYAHRHMTEPSSGPKYTGHVAQVAHSWQFNPTSEVASQSLHLLVSTVLHFSSFVNLLFGNHRFFFLTHHYVKLTHEKQDHSLKKRSKWTVSEKGMLLECRGHDSTGTQALLFVLVALFLSAGTCSHRIEGSRLLTFMKAKWCYSLFQATLDVIHHQLDHTFHSHFLVHVIRQTLDATFLNTRWTWKCSHYTNVLKSWARTMTSATRSLGPTSKVSWDHMQLCLSWA